RSSRLRWASAISRLSITSHTASGHSRGRSSRSRTGGCRKRRGRRCHQRRRRSFQDFWTAAHCWTFAGAERIWFFTIASRLSGGQLTRQLHSGRERRLTRYLRQRPRKDMTETWSNKALHRTANCAWGFALEFLGFISQDVAVG